MIEFKQGINARVAIRLLDSTGVPVTAVAFGSVAATIEKADGTTANMVMSGANWVEVTAGAFSGLGKYDLVIPASILDTPGMTVVAVTGPGANFVGTFKVIANEEAETNVAVTRAMGLLHENSVMDQTIFDANNNLTNARFRIYNSKANANLAGGGGLLNTYTITATYTGDNLLTYKVVLEP